MQRNFLPTFLTKCDIAKRVAIFPTNILGWTRGKADLSSSGIANNWVCTDAFAHIRFILSKPMCVDKNSTTSC